MGPAGVPGGPHDFKKAYMQVSDVFDHPSRSSRNLFAFEQISIGSFSHLLSCLQLVEDMASKAADGASEGQIAVTEDELRELTHMVSKNTKSLQMLHGHANLFPLLDDQKKLANKTSTMENVHRFN